MVSFKMYFNIRRYEHCLPMCLIENIQNQRKAGDPASNLGAGENFSLKLTIHNRPSYLKNFSKHNK